MRFDFETWCRLRAVANRRRGQAQENTFDHNFYDGDPTYSDMSNPLDARQNGDGDAYGLGPNEVREYYEDSNVTNAVPQEADVGEPGEHGVWDSDEGSPAHRASLRLRFADVAVMHPERYEDTPGFENGVFTTFFPNEDATEAKDRPPEGEWRYEDLDGSEPLGRPSTMVPGLSGEMTDGDLGNGDHDLEEQTPFGFQEHEASLRRLGSYPQRRKGDAFHSTPYKFELIDPDKSGLGSHFGTFQAAYDRFEKEYGAPEDNNYGPSRIIHYALDVKNPLRLGDVGNWDDVRAVADELEAHGFNKWEVRSCLIDQRDRKITQPFPFLRKLIESKGYDSVAYKNDIEHKGSWSYCVWNPALIRQEKSVPYMDAISDPEGQFGPAVRSEPSPDSIQPTAEQGNSLSDLVSQGRPDTNLSTSPEHVDDLLGRAADLRTKTCQSAQVVDRLPRGKVKRG